MIGLGCWRARTALLLALGTAACGEDKAVAPQGPRAVAGSASAQLAFAPEERAALAVALEDARSRILPTLGEDSATEALGSALAELERVLSQPEAATLAAALGRARAAAARLGAEPRLLPDVDVVLLVFDRIEALARGPAEPVVNADACAARLKPGAADPIATPCNPRDPRREP